MKISLAVARKHKVLVKPSKNVPSVRWSPLPSWIMHSISYNPNELLMHNVLHNPNELLPFSEITGPVRNTIQGKETVSYFKLFLLIKSSKT